MMNYLDTRVWNVCLLLDVLLLFDLITFGVNDL
jgi:hypothetical protein